MINTFLIFLALLISSCSINASSDTDGAQLDGPSQPEMTLVEGGVFEMGVEGGEFDEGPVHEVELSDFYIGKYEITVAQYRGFTKATGREMPGEPSWGWRDTDPIVNVSWTDAESYTKWLSKKTGAMYRLPTEAEWFYVATDGGKKIKYPWGDGSPKENVADESAKKKGASRTWDSYDDKFPYLAPVGSFPANSLGVHDLGGNAAEWVSNFHYTFPKSRAVNPQGPAEGKNKVFKGGSFRTNAWYSRIAQRNFMPVTFKQDYLGFRVVKEVNR